MQSANRVPTRLLIIPAATSAASRAAPLRSWGWLVLASVLLGWLGGDIEAQDFPIARPDPLKVAEQQNARRQALVEEGAAIARMREELLAQGEDISRRLSALRVGDVTQVAVDQARVDTEAARLSEEDLKAETVNTERRIKELEESIRDLQAREQLLKNPARGNENDAIRSEQLEATRQVLTQQQVELSLERQHSENLRQRLELVGMRRSLAGQWQSRVEELFRVRQERNRLEAQEDLASRLQRKRQDYLDRAALLTRRLEQEGDNLSEARRRRLETELKSAEEQANLVQLSIRLSSIGNDLARLDGLADRTEAKPEELREGLRQLFDLQRELRTSGELLQRKLELFQQQREVIERRDDLTTTDRAFSAEERQFINGVLNQMGALDSQIQQHIGRAETIRTRLENQYQDILHRDLLARKELPATIAEWKQRLGGIVEVPRILLYQVRLSLESTVKSMTESNVSRWIGLIFLEAGLLALVISARYRLARTPALLKAGRESNFSSIIITLLGKLLHRNLLGMGFAAALLVAVRLFRVPQPGQGIIITLALLWTGIKIPINLVGLVLAVPHLRIERRRHTLYWQWFWTLFFGGILSAMTILAHLSGVSQTVSEAFDRVFMLYLLLVTAPVLRARRFAIDLMAAHYARHRWFTGLRLTSFFLPLLLFATGVLGLVGYLNLAWTVAWYLIVSIAIVAAWLLAQGLFNDFMAVLNNYAVKHSGGEPLWPQDIIDPLYKIFSSLLFLGACIILFKIYGWDEDSTITTAWQVLVVAVIAVLAAYEAVYFLAGNIVRRSKSVFGGSLVRHSRQPLGVILPIAVAQIIVPTLPISGEMLVFVRHALVLAQIAAVSWLIVRLVSVMDDVAVHRYSIDAKDKLGARRVHTQMRMLRQIVLVAVYLIAISAMLMTFPKIRQLGAGLMASAGVAGLVIGIAARPFLANLIAGIQIGLTQPIRLDDEVIVEGEWGRVAEINPTHVIIQIWDDRRLVVPLNYFNEKPFENWTRTSTNLLATVFICVDYTFPVEAGRTELKRILDATDLWDGRAWALQVTKSTGQAMELRALMSARDASTAWDLRCHVRERFIQFVQDSYPNALPRTRAVLRRDKTTG